ncbi:MAG: hypothetical protein JSS83_14035 [Cyanobacteria bacterium SZAS LIN-3]|nr:hypothetical protein [Cyanobacteria bacterium SZAS LIN-3]
MTGVEEDLGYSKQQPPWHVFVLSVLTLSLYNFYWFYKNLLLLNQEIPAQSAATPTETAGKKPRFCQLHPYFSTLLFFLPVVNMIILMEFFAATGDLIPDQESFWHKNNLFCAFALALSFGALFLLSVLPNPYHLFYLTNALPLAVAQQALNKHWHKTENGSLLLRSAFNPLELVVIFFGAGCLGLVAISSSVLPH